MPDGSANDSGLTVSFLLLFVVYLVTAFPYLVAEQVHLLWHIKPEWNTSFDHAVIAYSLPLAHLNYLINPLVYAYRMPDYRNGLISLLTCRKTTRDNQRGILPNGNGITKTILDLVQPDLGTQL
jgi:hypothetical protein